jgi:SAM-dependent methyltransferase
VSGARIHPAAALGFEAAVARYDRGRPGYPPDAVDLLVQELGIGEGRDLLELGAGSGKFTELVVDTGARITAIEPVRAMRAALAARCPGVLVRDGTAESIPVADSSADAAVCAQAFHWFDADRALAEIHRVLRPGGGFGMIWNAREESSAWSRRLTAIFDRLSGDGPRYRDGRWRPAFDRTDRFGPLRHRATLHVHEVSRIGFVDRVLSVSYVASASEGERRRVLAEVEGLLEGDPDLAGRERIGIPYRTDVFWTTRR